MSERRDEYDWQQFALCRGVDSDLFFAQNEEEAGPAKAICRECPVRMPCLAFALARNERFGVWGGTTERERARLPSSKKAEIIAQASASAA